MTIRETLRKILIQIGDRISPPSNQPAHEYEMTKEHKQAIELIADQPPAILIHGKAGTGKSVFINQITEHFNNVVVLAPTGVAALNVKGKTIHSFFSFPWGVLNHKATPHRNEFELWKQLYAIVIDEISMVRADIFDCIDSFLRIHTGKRDQPFGGVVMILIGDLHQLAPVLKPEDAGYFYNYLGYKGEFFFHAHCLQEFRPRLIEFRKVFRTDEMQYTNLLDQLRNKSGEIDQAVESFNLQCPTGPCDDLSTTVFVCRRTQTDYVNKSRLSAIPTKPRTFNAIYDEHARFSKSDLPCPEKLTLKVGAKVMFVRNDEADRWVNGTIGQVVNLEGNMISIEVQRGAKLECYEVFRATWEYYKYIYNDELRTIVRVIDWTYTQFPLILAWAVTIHKGQGLTMDKMHIDFGTGTFSDGQAYVALSRCRSIRNISLERNIRISDIKCSSEVERFLDELRSSSSPNFKATY